jgi:hypothetical protein
MLLLIARHDDRPNVVVDHIVKPLSPASALSQKSPIQLKAPGCREFARHAT